MDRDSMDEIKSIIETVTVNITPETAFSAFVEELNEWWPQGYTWSQDVLEEIGIEPKQGGFCYEIGPSGFRCDWGKIVEYEPPQLLKFTWQIGPNREPVPNPDKASKVIVSFERGAKDVTHVKLEHTQFHNHGEGAEGYHDAMASEYGWPYILKRFRDHADEK